MIEGRLLSPVISTYDRRILGSAFLFLRSEHFVISLDSIAGPDAVKQKLQIRHNQYILEGSPVLLRSYARIQRLEGQIIRISEDIVKASRRKGKRAAAVGDEGHDDCILVASPTTPLRCREQFSINGQKKTGYLWDVASSDWRLDVEPSEPGTARPQKSPDWALSHT